MKFLKKFVERFDKQTENKTLNKSHFVYPRPPRDKGGWCGNRPAIRFVSFSNGDWMLTFCLYWFSVSMESPDLSAERFTGESEGHSEQCAEWNVSPYSCTCSCCFWGSSLCTCTFWLKWLYDILMLQL